MKICTIEGCDKHATARGWCGKHYRRWTRYGDPTALAPRRRESDVCDAPDCERPTPQGKYCNMHKLRLWKKGVLELAPRPTRREHSQGYMLLKGAGHPLTNASGWVYEHRAVLFAAIGPGAHPCHWCGDVVSWERSYPEHADGLTVDHIDEDKANNDPANLVASCARCNFERSSRWVKQRRKETSA